ncbi:MAG: hypothetical protein HHAS10_06320 [Candidatus Altimarinota bacterium]
MPTLPPHLTPEEDEEAMSTPLPPPKIGKFGRQGPSKYGAGGRRVAKAKGRKKK